MKTHAPLAVTLLLAACTTEGPLTTTTRPQTVAIVQPQPVQPVAAPTPAVSTRPIDASGAAPVIEEVEVVSTTPPPPPAGARTVEEFDTTTAEERTAAAAPPPASPAPAASASASSSGDGRLGTTVASLGAAEEPGFWIKTPLVSERKPGRLYYAATGRNVQVQLIPSSDGGSQVSLAAMRLLDAPLDGLPELVVYAN